MPTKEELIAHEKEIAEIAGIIGADKLIYQDYDDFVNAVYHDKSSIDGFEMSCFTGNYIT